MVASTRIATAHHRLAERARRQHSLFTRAQAVTCGISPRSISRYLATGQWCEPFPGVLVAGTHTLDDLQRACGAVLAAGPDAALSHMSAVALHGLAPWPMHVDLTVPHGTFRRLDGVRWHQSRVLYGDDLASVRGIRATTIERSLLDAATQADHDLLTQLVDEAVRLKMTSVGHLAARAVVVRPDGRFGGYRLRRVLEAVPPLQDADSVLEMVMARLLDQPGLDDYRHHHLVDVGGVTYELDFAYVAERLDVECDGAAFHDGPSRQLRDAERDSDLVRAGWTVLRFRWNDVTTRAAATRRAILAALDRTGGPPDVG
ncbi:MAG: DUF559 domain-containing protein [Acidimicrobiia bacterium]|nr:DUF559 domain-containing protein [Acidimicrobiia bacterium]